MTRTEEFNKSLEIQQSKPTAYSGRNKSDPLDLDLLALYDVNAKITAIEDMVAQGADVHTVIRLLCLASVIVGGVKTKALESLKREILQV